MKVVLVGSVGSSQIVLEELIKAKVDILHVFSLDEQVSGNVSGYVPLHLTAQEHGIPYTKFVKIGDTKYVEMLKKMSPDYIFIVGLSQIVKQDLMETARRGVIGFHPTPLPKFRGRAAMVWQVLLGVHETKCTMFFINEGMDSGDIIAQEPYCIEDTDYASDVADKLLKAIRRLTVKVIEKLQQPVLEVTKQNEAEATYLLKRSPEDGLIDWSMPIKKIHCLVRAVSHPYPGAFSNYDGKHKIIIWRAEILENTKYIGVCGQIAEIDDAGFYVVCADGLLHVTDYENVDNVKMFVGHKLKDF